MLDGILIGLLSASAMLNAVLLWTRFDVAKAWRERAREAEDAKKATELRSSAQIDAILDRMHSPVLDASRAVVPKRDPEVLTYIPDTPDADSLWNEYRGEPDEEE